MFGDSMQRWEELIENNLKEFYSLENSTNKINCGIDLSLDRIIFRSSDEPKVYNRADFDNLIIYLDSSINGYNKSCALLNIKINSKNKDGEYFQQFIPINNGLHSKILVKEENRTILILL